MREERVGYVVVGLGALGSATAWHLAEAGHDVVGLERFELGHSRGASHDTSRILRHSYHTPAYVELTRDAYDDWARLEAVSGEHLVTVVGGLDLFPTGGAIPMEDYTTSLTRCDIAFELLESDEVVRRWPQFSLPADTVGLFQERGAIVPAGFGTSVMQRVARAAGARLLDSTPVLEITEASHGVRVSTAGSTYLADAVVVCADAWTNDVLTGLDVSLPLTTTLEQVTYLQPAAPARFAPGALPLWIWMDDPSYYGFPCYGEDTVKVAEDCGGPEVSPDARTSDPDAGMLRRLSTFMASLLPESGPTVRSLRCQYTLTPDRDFVIAPVPGHERVVVGLGAAHGFKFAPTFGRLLAELAATGSSTTDLSPFRFDRPALTDPAFEANWMV
ncbi:N-methyl-L-tryptophan oxidase [Nocardioides sp.]|uniref:N-methyl-L-tryptophan oxidase n=1 Tax=Nocardioides sp. TaxID=35761 RepID=UPI002ED344A0